MHTPRTTITLAVDKNCIYAIGGSTGGIINGLCWVRPLKSVERYDSFTDTWKQVANLKFPRHSAAAVTLNGEVYVIGGFILEAKGQNKQFCEKYSPLSDRWAEIPAMQQERYFAGATVANGKIYVAGGLYEVGSIDDKVLNSVEVYDPKEKVWQYINPMTSPRSSPGLISLSGNLVAVGGRGKYKDLKSTEIYSFAEEKWIKGPEMKKARSGMGIAWIQNEEIEKLKSS